MNIRIPMQFIKANGGFSWLLDDAAKARLEEAVAGGDITRAAADETIQMDAEARSLDGAFAGFLLFEQPTLAVGNVIHAEGARRAREQAQAEKERAEAKNIRPRFTLTAELINETAHAIRPELTFAGAEGEGSEGYERWENIPDPVKALLPGMLAPHYTLDGDMAKVLKKKPAC